MKTILKLFTYFSILAGPLQAANFYIRDLDALTTDQSIAGVLNDSNCVAGSFQDGSKKHDFIWDPQSGLKILPIEDSVFYQIPLINNKNEVIGLYWQKTNYFFSKNGKLKHLYFISSDGQFRDLEWPKKWKNELVGFWDTDQKELNIVDFNDNGEILIVNSQDEKKVSACAVWSQGKYHYIDPKILSNGYALNNRGQILGRKWVKDENGSNVPKLVLYDKTTESCQEICNDVNILKKDLNDQAEVVLIQFFSDKSLKGYSWNAENGLLCYENFLPITLNNHGEMVGAKLGENKDFTYHYFSKGVITDLNETLKIGESSPWSKIQMLTTINDNGWISGQGVFNSKHHGFIIIPKEQE